MSAKFLGAFFLRKRPKYAILNIILILVMYNIIRYNGFMNSKFNLLFNLILRREVWIKLFHHRKMKTKNLKKLIALWLQTHEDLRHVRVTDVSDHKLNYVIWVSTTSDCNKLLAVIPKISGIDNTLNRISCVSSTSIKISSTHNMDVFRDYLTANRENYDNSIKDIRKALTLRKDPLLRPEIMIRILEYLGNLPVIRDRSKQLAYILDQHLTPGGISLLNAQDKWRTQKEQIKRRGLRLMRQMWGVACLVEGIWQTHGADPKLKDKDGNTALKMKNIKVFDRRFPQSCVAADMQQTFFLVLSAISMAQRAYLICGILASCVCDNNADIRTPLIK